MKNEDPTGFTKGEIAAAIISVMIPVIIFVVVLTPGAVDMLARAALQPGVLPVLSIIGAFIAAGVLAFRIWSRTRKAKKKKKGKPGESDGKPGFWAAWRNPYR